MCIKTKRDYHQQLEDLKYARNQFIQNHNLRVKSILPTKTIEYQEKETQHPIEGIAEIGLCKKQIKVNAQSQKLGEEIFKKPRLLRRRKIVPVAWNFISSYVQKKNQDCQIPGSEEPAAYNTTITKADSCNQQAPLNNLVETKLPTR